MMNDNEKLPFRSITNNQLGTHTISPTFVREKNSENNQTHQKSSCLQTINVCFRQTNGIQIPFFIKGHNEVNYEVQF